MKIELEIPDYTADSGFRFIWEEDHVIATKIYKDKMYIAANAAGLRSLAYHLLTLAQDTVPTWHDLDYHDDGWGSLEDGSPPLFIYKVADAEGAQAALQPLPAEEQERRRALREYFSEQMRLRAEKERPTDD